MNKNDESKLFFTSFTIWSLLFINDIEELLFVEEEQSPISSPLWHIEWLH